MEKNLKMISTVCYIINGDKVLMLHRNKQFYRGLGGKAEQGESPIDCIKREVKEESGLDINPIWKGIATFSKASEIDWEAHVFIATKFSGEIIDSLEGELHWISKSELLNLDMPEGDKKLLPLLFEESKFHAHLKYDDYKNLVSLKVDTL